jgi:hypothetical protein
MSSSGSFIAFDDFDGTTVKTLLYDRATSGFVSLPGLDDPMRRELTPSLAMQ